MVYPPGTAPVDSGLGCCMTCSDKMVKWNVLGLQGSFLSNVYEPIYVKTITVGESPESIIFNDF
jgi:tRNA-specific adenosine deaminase 1